MKKEKKQIEVLAPAGSYESMAAAVNAGADAVYMGGTRFGARAYAENPEEDMLLSAIDYVHLHGKKIYLTVNTLLKERELTGDLFDFLLPYYLGGADALIIQDMGVMKAVRRWFPDWPLHASTQMTITGPDGAAFARSQGASRIVTARELSLDEIRRIRDQVDVEIETFVHGALCYCYSGQCLYSSLIGGRSGNRGRCAQPCRLPFDVWEGDRRRTSPEERYVMNLKDLCSLDFLPELLKAGVDSLKIEGRMKSPRYTAGVVSIYRKYVDLYQEKGEAGYRVAKEDKEFLLELFDRGGFSGGYFKNHNGKSMVALGEKPVYRKVDETLFSELDEKYVNAEKKEAIKGVVNIKKGVPASLSLSMGDSWVSVEGETAFPAKNRPLTEPDVKKQVEKLGGTPFVFEKLEVHLEEGTFLPLKGLNELRRRGLEALREAILETCRRSLKESSGKGERSPSGKGEEEKSREEKKVKVTVLVEEMGQFMAALKNQFTERIYLSLDQVPWDRISHCGELCRKAGKEFYLALPEIFREKARRELLAHEREWKLPCVDGFLIRVVDELPLVEALNEAYDCVADHSLYTFNREAEEVLESLGISRDTAPVELNERELRDRGLRKSELIVYGRLPMMVSAQCIRRTTKGCDKNAGILMMADRKKKRFPVKNYCRFCYNRIYNSEPLWLADELLAVGRLHPASVRLQFTVEGPEEVSQVLKAYEEAWEGKIPGYQPAARTKGHFRRGVE